MGARRIGSWRWAGTRAVGLLVALAVAGCGAGTGRVTGVAVAGPSCPVESAAPACSPQPLAGLALTIVRMSYETVVGQATTSAGGVTAAQTTTDAAGSFSVQLEPGRYYVFGPGVEGTTPPPPVLFDVSAGSTTSVTIPYVTGIR